MQLSPALHARPHIPQFVVLVAVSTHPPQSVCPVGQVIEARHVPDAHVCPAAHTVVHVPQCVGSASSDTHAPEQLI